MRNPLSGIIHLMSFIACVNLMDTHWVKNTTVLTICMIGNAFFAIRDFMPASRS